MRISPRIWIPVAAAVGVAGILLFLLWWQLSETAKRLKEELKDVSILPAITDTFTPTEIDANTADVALLHLRKGDLFALQGEWNEAENEYKAAVDAGGGLSALRKLAQAQLQRRNIDGVRATIHLLKQEGARAEDLLLLESIVHLRTGELVKAREILEQAVESPQKHYGLALLSLIQGTHEQAKAELLQVLGGWDPVLRSYAQTLKAAYDEFALFPESQELHLITLLSRALAQVQECELALPLLVQVLAQQDDYRDAWIVQGYCELVTERYDQSLASLERAYSIDPEKAEVQYFLARAHAALNDHQNAITFFSYALANCFKPEREVRRWIATEASEVGNGPLALEQYQALAGAEDATVESHRDLITLLLVAEKKEEAYGAALKAVVRFPGDASLQELLGQTATETNRKAEAKAAYEKALQLNPKSETAQEALKKLQ